METDSGFILYIGRMYKVSYRELREDEACLFKTISLAMFKLRQVYYICFET